MKKIKDFFKKLFEKKYTDYEIFMTETKNEEIFVPLSYGDFDEIFHTHNMIGTGVFHDVTYQTLVKYHKITGKPKYKTITL